MNLLLDTCEFLWLITDDANLKRHRKEAILSPENTVFLSAASSFEITVKCSIGKLDLPEHPACYIPKARERHLILPLPITEEAVMHIADFPLHHRDPFDRMLLSQALHHGMTLVSSDPKIHLYDVQTL